MSLLKKPEVFLVSEDPYKNRQNLRVAIDHRQALAPVAELAKIFAIEWGKIPYEKDSEDSAGRQTFKRKSPKEVVDDSFDAAEYFLNRASKDGYVIDLPSVRENNEYVPDEETS